MNALHRVAERIRNVNPVSSIHLEIKSCKKDDSPDCGIGLPSIKGGKNNERPGTPTIEGAGGPKCGIGVPTIRGGLSVGLNPPGPLLGKEKLQKLKEYRRKMNAIKPQKVGGQVVLPPKKFDPAGGTPSDAAPAAPPTLPVGQIISEEVLHSLADNAPHRNKTTAEAAPGEEGLLKEEHLKITVRADEYPISTNTLNSMRNAINKKLVNPLVKSVSIKVSIGRGPHSKELDATKSKQVTNVSLSEEEKSSKLKDVKQTKVCTVKLLKSDESEDAGKKKK